MNKEEDVISAKNPSQNWSDYSDSNMSIQHVSKKD